MISKVFVWGVILLLSLLLWWAVLAILEFILFSMAYVIAFFIPLVYLGSIHG